MANAVSDRIVFECLVDGEPKWEVVGLGDMDPAAVLSALSECAVRNDVPMRKCAIRPELPRADFEAAYLRAVENRFLWHNEAATRLIYSDG